MSFLDYIPLIGDVASGLMSADAQRSANRANLKNAREQRAWEQEMSNTAVSRRADDFEKAGFNRLLAATGVGASTPSVSAPINEPVIKPGQFNIGAAAATAAQIAATKAATELTTQKARQEKVVADYMTEPVDSVGGTRGKFDLQTKTLQKSLDAELTRYRKDMTASQLKQFDAASEAVVQQAKQQAERGKIDLEQLKALIESFGLGAEAKAGLIKTLMQIILPLLTTGGK